MSIRDLFRRKPKAPTPPSMKIAGIHLICYRLGLRKAYQGKPDGRKMIVDMESGRQAVYAYTDYHSASGVDWGWHVYTFERYVEPGEVLNYVRYN